MVEAAQHSQPMHLPEHNPEKLIQLTASLGDRLLGGGGEPTPQQNRLARHVVGGLWDGFWASVFP
jgi:hypothetical protein